MFAISNEDLDAAKKENNKLRYELESCGCHQCDAPACNCGGYHNNRAERLLCEKIEIQKDHDIHLKMLNNVTTYLSVHGYDMRTLRKEAEEELKKAREGE